ncbi:MAG: ATP-binding protein [Desulfovibrionales bacterium]|nr:ATP-binding protein [Desulfovibrionales bacterium]
MISRGNTPFLSGKRSFYFIYSLCGLIVFFFLMLGVLLHNSQQSLRQTKKNTFISDAQKTTSALKGYFAERNRDIRTLASAQAFSSYFHNEELGLSTEYGMYAILTEVRSTLKRFVLEYKVQGNFIFNTVTFTAFGNGTSITAQPSASDAKNIIITSSRSTSNTPSEPITFKTVNGKQSLSITVPFFISGAPSGELRAELSTAAIGAYLALINNSKEFTTTIAYEETLFPELLLNHSLQIDPGILHQLPFSTFTTIMKGFRIKNHAIPMAVIKNPIVHGKISAISFIKIAELRFGQLSDNILIIFYGVFLAAAASIAIAAHVMMRNYSLIKSLQEASDSNESTTKHLEKLQSEIVVRREAEIAALTAQQKAEQLTHVVPSAVFTVTLERKISSWNKRAEELTGYSSKEMIGSPCDAILCNSCQRVCPLFSHSQPPSNKSQHSLRMKNGQLRTIIKNTERMVDGFGRATGLIECFDDVTDQQKMVAELAKAEANYRDIIQNAQDGIFQSTLSGNILNANPAFLNIFEFNSLDELRNSFLGLENTLYVEPSRRAQFVNIMLNKRFIANFESQIRTRTGKTLWVTESARLRTAEDGTIRFEGFVRDITAQKVAEQNLISAKEAAEAANIAKNNFLANISHELRTPMNAIMGISELSLRSEADPERKRNMQVLHQASKSLLTLLNDLLDFSAIESNALSLTHAPFSLRELSDNLHELMKGEAKRKKLTLNIFTDTSVPSVLIGDKDRIKQILVNLVWNALKFTETGSVTVQCTANPIGPEEAPVKTLITYHVKDTGRGIPEHKLAQIFESFEQIHKDTVSSLGGVGLGLSISRKLALRMGGELSVQSTVDEGSTFTVTIPCTLPHNAAEEFALQTALEQSKQPLKTTLPPLSILVAEDNTFSQEVLKQMLDEDNHTVTIVHNGEEVLEQLALRTFDVILMDVQMPVVNGIEASKIIRSGKIPYVAPDIPIITISAHDLLSSQKELDECGITYSLQKPITINSLQRALCSICPTCSIVTTELVPYSETLQNELQSTTSSYVEMDKIIEMVNGKEHLVHSVLQTYCETLPSILDTLEAAITSDDKETITRLAHSLKATTKSLGASSLSELAYQIEKYFETTCDKELQHLFIDFKFGALQSLEEAAAILSSYNNAEAS